MTLGSLFNGISGWILAAEKYGVKTLWESEIDDYCETVTHYHYPNVKQLGDITKLRAEDLEPVDIISAGSPCQGLSLSGKRKGLNDERSGLFVDAIKLVHGLRERTGKPRYFVWENVPGAFSSNKGMDFRAVLEEISQTEIPVPPGGKWAEAGMVEWGGGSLAWRVLDAQYWGVPQRRKRIFLVADFGGLTAGEILFECQGLPRNPTESQGEGQEAAGNVGKGVDSADKCLTPWDVQSNRIQSINGVQPALYGGAGKGAHNGAVFVPAITFWDGSQTCSTLTANNAGGNQRMPDKNHFNAVISKKSVRRLTPTECERLQGLPDSYTDIEFNGKHAPDSRRYKALGNGMAQPCADYVIKRIVDNYIGNA